MQYNTKDSSVKLAYEAQPRPRAIVALAGEKIVKVACGTNHTGSVKSLSFPLACAQMTHSYASLLCDVHFDFNKLVDAMHILIIDLNSLTKFCFTMSVLGIPVAVDSKGYVYTYASLVSLSFTIMFNIYNIESNLWLNLFRWGFGGYGRLVPLIILRA